MPRTFASSCHDYNVASVTLDKIHYLIPQLSRQVPACCVIFTGLRRPWV
jgi:hypothetical protein